MPNSFASLSNLDNFTIDGNNLDRLVNPTHFAELSPTVLAWFNALVGTHTLNNQNDVTPPVISATGTIPLAVTGAFPYSITIQENSYAVNSLGSGMAVVFSGG